VQSKDVLTEGFGRLPDLVLDAVEGLSPEQLRQPPAKGANTVAWLIWHLTRVQDSHIAELIDNEQVYITGDWARRFGLKADPTDTGYAHVPAEVEAVRPDDWQTLVAYYQAVHERTIGYLAGLGDADLDAVVDDSWDPPVTLGVRLISVYDDDTQHAGQAAFVRGLL
jgi:uncharacterized damage-inducible protein DinB